MTNKTKFKTLFICIILATITYVVIQIIRFYHFVTSGSIEGILWGIGTTIIVISLIILYLWIGNKLYDREVKRHRAEVAQKYKEYKEEEEQERNRIKDGNDEYLLTLLAEEARLIAKADNILQEAGLPTVTEKRAAEALKRKEKKTSLKTKKSEKSCHNDNYNDDDDGAWEDDFYAGNDDWGP